MVGLIVGVILGLIGMALLVFVFLVGAGVGMVLEQQNQAKQQKANILAALQAMTNQKK